MRTSEPRPLVSVRTMLIVLLGFLVGAVAGGLTVLAGDGWPAAVLLAGTATAGAICFFNSILD